MTKSAVVMLHPPSVAWCWLVPMRCAVPGRPGQLFASEFPQRHTDAVRVSRALRALSFTGPMA